VLSAYFRASLVLRAMLATDVLWQVHSSQCYKLEKQHVYPQIDFFGFKIASYGLFAVIGCLVCGFVLCYLLKKRGIMMEDGVIFLMTVIAGVFIGGHLLFALTNIRLFPYLFKKAEFPLWLARVQYIFGGSVFYGGLFGGLAAGAIALKCMSHDRRIYADIMAPIIPLFHGIARIGCFLAGCCYGIESEFGFRAHGNTLVPEVNDVRRFPVQLLEAGCNLFLVLAMFLLLKASRKKPFLQGKLIYFYLITYGIIRFLDEFLRGDEVRGFIGIFSTSQWISIISVGISSLLLVSSIIKEKRLPISVSCKTV